MIEKNLLPVGTITVLKSDPDHFYTKIEDEGFAWWIFNDPSKEEDRRMQVRQTDEQVLSATHFNTFVPADEYLEKNY